jgi:hypothetical protein
MLKTEYIKGPSEQSSQENIRTSDWLCAEKMNWVLFTLDAVFSLFRYAQTGCVISSSCFYVGDKMDGV